MPFPPVSNQGIDHKLTDVIDDHRQNADAAIHAEFQSNHKGFLAAG